jgi:hypothetical protein
MKRWIMAFALICVSCSVTFAQKASDVATLVFGEAKASKKVEKGALFIDGAFVRAPYTVTRQGNVILVNGTVAARLKIEAAKKTPEVVEEAPEAPAEETPSTEIEAPEEVGDELPPPRTLTREEQDAAAKEKSDAMRKRSGYKSLKDKEEERKKAKIAKPKPAFNQEAAAADPEALFEEADYTYTPPSKAEPKAVPYVRPAATKSLKERMLEDDAKKAAKKAEEMEAKASKNASKPSVATTKSDDESAAVEDPAAIEKDAIESLEDEDTKRYLAELEKRHKQIEDALQKDQMVFLSSTSWAWKTFPKAEMQKFIVALERPGSWDKFSKQWKAFPQQYLRKIYDQIDENVKNTKMLRIRIQKEQRASKNKPSRV